MSNHTPGPWDIDWNIGRLDIHSSGPRIATVPRNVRDDEADRVAQQNARLIAAAPDLLASLSEIINYDGGADSVLNDEYVMERAVAAISKATGEQT